MNAELDLPLCAVCRTRVASLEHVFDPNARRGLGAYTLIAHCHGEREAVDISDADLVAMVPSSLRVGVAFAELDLRDRAFSAPRPYQGSEAFRYGAHHGDTPNGPAAPSLNGLVDFRRLPTR